MPYNKYETFWIIYIYIPDWIKKGILTMNHYCYMNSLLLTINNELY